jgi:hypothetical protein
MLPVKGSEQLRYVRESDRLHDADAQRSPQDTSHGGRDIADLLGACERPAGGRQQGLSGTGQGDAVRRAVEEADAELSLEGLD